MDLGSALPPELVTACQPAGGAAPGLQRRPAADAADDATTPAGFDLLLQMLLGQAPGGQPLPAAGQDLPAPSAIPAAALASTTLPASPGTAPPAGAASSPPACGAPVDDPAAALRAALAAASPDQGGTIASAPAPSSAPKPPVADLAPPAPLVADLQAADAPHDGAALDASEALAAAPASAPVAAPAAAPVAAPGAAPAPADPSSDAVAALAATVSSVASDAADPARPRVRAANALSAERWTVTRTPAGDDAAAAPAAGDDAAALPPPAPTAAAQALTPHVVSHDEAVQLVLQPAAEAAPSGGAALGHAAAHAVGASVPTTAAPAAAAPAQAALPQTPVDTTAARWHEALASRVHWLVDHNVGEARIRLNPPELGALDVKVSLQDDKTFVQVTAHTAAARDELTQSLPRLRALLSAGGLALGGATVSGGHDDRAGRYAAAEPARPVDFAGGVEPVFAARPASSSARGLVDLFA